MRMCFRELRASRAHPSASGSRGRSAGGRWLVLAGWGNKWGNRPHVSQPIPAELDLPKTALESAPRIPAGLWGRTHNRTVRVGTRRSRGLPSRIRAPCPLAQPHDQSSAVWMQWGLAPLAPVSMRRRYRTGSSLLAVEARSVAAGRARHCQADFNISCRTPRRLGCIDQTVCGWAGVQTGGMGRWSCITHMLYFYRSSWMHSSTEREEGARSASWRIPGRR